MKQIDDNQNHSQEQQHDKERVSSMNQNAQTRPDGSSTEDAASLSSAQRRAPQHAPVNMTSAPAPKPVPLNPLGNAAATNQLANSFGLNGNNLLQQLGMHRLVGVDFGRQQQLVQFLLQSSRKREEEMNAQIQKAASILSAPPGKAAQAEQQRPIVSSSTVDSLKSSASTTNQTEVPNHDTTKMPAGSVLMPCRARGMPRDHNSKSAFFIIPNNIAHGEGLRCSHVACRNRGIRFRYCSICSLPVAKRNFSTRHHHGNLVVHSIKNDDGSQDLVPPGNVKALSSSAKALTSSSGKMLASKPSDKKRGRESPKLSSNKELRTHHTEKRSGKRYEEDDIVITTDVSTSASSYSTSNSTGSSITTEGERGFEDGILTELTTSKTPRPSPEPTTVLNVGFLREKRTMEWLDLLNKRPRTENGDEMSAWLMQVMAVSDPSARQVTENTAGFSDSSSSPTDESGNAGSGRSDGSSEEDYSRNNGGTHA